MGERHYSIGDLVELCLHKGGGRRVSNIQDKQREVFALYLGEMKPSALKKHAKEVGVEESKLDEADDADDVKAKLLEAPRARGFLCMTGRTCLR